MTNKRQLKKYIHNTCGELAAELILASRIFDGYDQAAVDKIIIEIAALQNAALSNANFSFDKVAHDFENKAEYRKALCSYRRIAYAKLLDDFSTDIEALVKQMNEVTPQTVRDTFKSLN